MKITIELNKGDEKDPSVIALLGGSTLLALLDTDTRAMREAHTRNDKQDDKQDDEQDDTPPEEGEEPTFRAYGESSGGRARRTKLEMAQDENIEELFAKAKELGAKGLPKKIDTTLPAYDIEKELATMVEVMSDDEEGFEVDGGDTPTSEDPMDLDEFRAVLTKAVKALGGKAMSGLMDPYKSATDVPGDERNAYAEKLNDAMG